jgi:hypothetical protein
VFSTQITPPSDTDIIQLEKWRKEFATADLELPENYVSDGVATAVAKTKEGKLIGSLTASIILAVSLDPLIRNPDSGRTETLAGLFALTRALEYQAALNGAAASFIAVPNLLPNYQELVVKCGFEPTAQHCSLYRHSFR